MTATAYNVTLEEAIDLVSAAECAENGPDFAEMDTGDLIDLGPQPAGRRQHREDRRMARHQHRRRTPRRGLQGRAVRHRIRA
jgi:hypothetical protein